MIATWNWSTIWNDFPNGGQMTSTTKWFPFFFFLFSFLTSFYNLYPEIFPKEISERNKMKSEDLKKEKVSSWMQFPHINSGTCNIHFAWMFKLFLRDTCSKSCVIFWVSSVQGNIAKVEMHGLFSFSSTASRNRRDNKQLSSHELMFWWVLGR